MHHQTKPKLLEQVKQCIRTKHTRLSTEGPMLGGSRHNENARQTTCMVHMHLAGYNRTIHQALCLMQKMNSQCTNSKFANAMHARSEKMWG